MALKNKIKCNGIKPTKTEVYILAAELVETEKLLELKTAVIEALKSYDYYDAYDYNYDYNYNYDYYNYDYYDYYYDYDYYYYYDYYDYSDEEKVIALLFLAAMYSESK